MKILRLAAITAVVLGVVGCAKHSRWEHISLMPPVSITYTQATWFVTGSDPHAYRIDDHGKGLDCYLQIIDKDNFNVRCNSK